MNLSGKAVKYWMDKEKIALEQLLVIVDDVALPLNKITACDLRVADAGHNGLKKHRRRLCLPINIQDYGLVSVMIIPKGCRWILYLGKWTPEELPLVKLKVEKCVEVIENFISIGIERTMNEVE